MPPRTSTGCGPSRDKQRQFRRTCDSRERDSAAGPNGSSRPNGMTCTRVKGGDCAARTRQGLLLRNAPFVLPRLIPIPSLSRNLAWRRGPLRAGLCDCQGLSPVFGLASATAQGVDAEAHREALSGAGIRAASRIAEAAVCPTPAGVASSAELPTQWGARDHATHTVLDRAVMGTPDQTHQQVAPGTHIRAALRTPGDVIYRAIPQVGASIGKLPA